MAKSYTVAAFDVHGDDIWLIKGRGFSAESDAHWSYHKPASADKCFDNSRAIEDLLNNRGFICNVYATVNEKDPMFLVEVILDPKYKYLGQLN